MAFFYFKGDLGLMYFVMGGMVGLLLLFCLAVLQKDHTSFTKLAYILAGLVYVAMPLALSNAVVFRGGAFSGLLMIAFFCIIWASDIGAYCFGMLFGQKLWPAKMCPRISPKKSWAGFIGGLLMAVLAGAIISWTGLVQFPIWHCMIMAALMHVTGVFGDLFESLWKRAAGIKDSGSIIPGHGGLLDRFDSSLFAIPTGVIYLVITGLF
jgi:phosphatidate cytidylyltransferase